MPFAPGGSVDGLARVIANKLSEQLSQPFIVESRPGAGSIVGADAVAKSAPDGYTLLHNTVGQATAPALFRSLPFDALKDYAPVTQLVASNLVLVVNSQLPANSTQELIALAKAKPTSLNYGMTGVGNILHLTMEMFKHSTGTEIQAVPYRGDGLVLNAVIAGEVQVAVVALAIAKPLIESGKIRALGIASSKRSAFMPDLPSIAETVPGFNSASWQALFAPAKTPKDIINLLQREIAKALASPDVTERLRGWTNEPVGSRPEVFEAYFREEVEKYRKVARDIGMPQQD